MSSGQTPGPASGQSSKRSSPPVAVGAPAAKRMRGDEDGGTATPGSTTATGGAADGVGGGTVDPEQLSDALLSAGVDLKEEENLLSSSLHQDQHETKYQQQPVQQQPLVQGNFLDLRNLNALVKKRVTAMGVKYFYDKDNELMTLLSISCEEFLTDIVTKAAALSRHRRASRNDVQSNISKALRNLATQERELEQQRAQQRAALGLDGAGTGEKRKDNEETQHRAANATALMMTSGKKKYSWLSGGAGPGAPRTPAMRAKTDNNIRVREAREEPGVALRDLLGALEEQRMGTEKALIKGYARMRN